MQCIKGEDMAQQIPVNLKKQNIVTLENDHLLPTTFAELVRESEDKQFISQEEKNRYENKQDKLTYIPLNQAGDTMTGPLILSKDKIQDDKQAATKEYVDQKIADIVHGASSALDTLYELAAAIDNDPNFSVTVSTLVGTKLEKDAANTIATPNKLLYLDSNGELNTNAASASKLKNAFSFSIAGDIVMDSVLIDGSKDIVGNIYIDQLSESDVERIFNQT